MNNSNTSRLARRRSLWQIAAAIPPRRNAIVLLSLVAASASEGLGIATLLPLIAVLGDQGSGGNQLSRLILGAIDSVGLPRAPIVLLMLISVAMLLKSVLALVALGQVGRAVADVGAGVRVRLIEALLRARWSFFIRQPTGRFANALGEEASRAGDAYDAMMHMLSLGVQALIYLTIAAIASWRLALLAIIVCVFMLGSLNKLILASKRNSAIQNEQLRRLLSRLSDVLGGIKPMKAMARQSRFSALFMQDLNVIKVAVRRQIFAAHTNRSLQEPILALSLTVGIYVAIEVIHMQIGEVMVMSLLLAKTVSTVGNVQHELQNVFRHESQFWGVRQAIDEAEAEREIFQGTKVPMFTQEIAFDRVCFAFDERVILRDASFSIRPGEVVALTGASGAGKTTLVDLLLGLNSPQSGSILIDGVAMPDIAIEKWRQGTGYVPQELVLFHDSILANVTLGDPIYSRADVSRALAAAGAQEFVDQLPQGMDTVVGEHGAALSGGQRQRIALARALVTRPKLLVLDEATSALDPATESQIVGNVVQLVHDTGLTVLAISHHPAWVAAADSVLHLKGGIVYRHSNNLPAVS
jgi:ATP-binding cassette subfamily C protein